MFCNLVNPKSREVHSVEHGGNISSVWIITREESLIRDEIDHCLDEGIAQYHVVEHIAPYLGQDSNDAKETPSSGSVANGAPCIYDDFLHELVRKCTPVYLEFLVLRWKRSSIVERTSAQKPTCAFT